MPIADRLAIKNCADFEAQYVTKRQIAERMSLLLPISYLQSLSYISGFEAAVQFAMLNNLELRMRFGSCFPLDKPYRVPFTHEKITLESYPRFIPPCYFHRENMLRKKKVAAKVPLFYRKDYHKLIQSYLPVPLKLLPTITKTFELLVCEAVYDEKRIRFSDWYIGGFTRENPARDKFVERMPFCAFSKNFTVSTVLEWDGKPFAPWETRTFRYFSGQYLYYLAKKYQHTDPTVLDEMWSYSYRQFSRAYSKITDEEMVRELIKLKASDEEAIVTGLIDYSLPQALLYSRIITSKIREKHYKEKEYEIPMLIDLPPKHIWKPEYQALSENDIYRLVNKSAIMHLDKLEYTLEDEDGENLNEILSQPTLEIPS